MVACPRDSFRNPFPYLTSPTLYDIISHRPKYVNRKQSLNIFGLFEHNATQSSAKKLNEGTEAKFYLPPQLLD